MAVRLYRDHHTQPTYFLQKLGHKSPNTIRIYIHFPTRRTPRFTSVAEIVLNYKKAIERKRVELEECPEEVFGSGECRLCRSVPFSNAIVLGRDSIY